MPEFGQPAHIVFNFPVPADPIPPPERVATGRVAAVPGIGSRAVTGPAVARLSGAHTGLGGRLTRRTALAGLMASRRRTCRRRMYAEADHAGRRADRRGRAGTDLHRDLAAHRDVRPRVGVRSRSRRPARTAARGAPATSDRAGVVDRIGHAGRVARVHIRAGSPCRRRIRRNRHRSLRRRSLRLRTPPRHRPGLRRSHRRDRPRRRHRPGHRRHSPSALPSGSPPTGVGPAVIKAQLSAAEKTAQTNAVAVCISVAAERVPIIAAIAACRATHVAALR